MAVWLEKMTDIFPVSLNRPIGNGKHMTINNRDMDNPLILSRESLLQYTTQGAIPQLRGQIKDHKEGDPMREISDASRSPGHKLAKIKYLTHILDKQRPQSMEGSN